MATDDRLTARQAAALAGVQPSTWTSYVSRQQAPAADGQFGNQNWWLRSTVETWLANRPGQGARTDQPTERQLP